MSLVALCFVAVLGITLTGYIAVCSRAMNLSNRSYQATTSQQLAEMGIEEALRAFNKNNWADWPAGAISVNWDTTTYAASNRAVATVTFPANKFGQGVTGSVKIRVDNYNAAQLNSTWNNTTTYRIGDLVGDSGIWYRCVQNGNLNRDPSAQTDLAWWVPVPVPWGWSSNTAYSANYDVVCSGGIWYRCINDHTSGSTFSVGSNWSSIPAPSLSWNSTTAYSVGAFVYRSGTWYRCTSAHTNQAPPNGSYWNPATSMPYISWAWRSTSTYTFNDLVFYSAPGPSAGNWYRCIAATSTNNLPTSLSPYWEYARSGNLGWSNAGTNYNLGDVVYYSTTGQWYRCIRAHPSSGSLTPSNTTYWSNAPLFSPDWDSGRQYSQNDQVRYNGVWYLSLQNGNTNLNPVTATTYWIGANTSTASYQWNPTTAYAVGSYRCYGGVWYYCSAAHTGQSPNNTAYWTAAWAQSAGVTTGAPVVYAEGTIAITGSPSLRTQLRATIAPAPLFPNAAAATTTISATSGGTVDSYDSVTDPTAATPGYSAVLAAGNPSSTAVTLSGALTVNGYVAAPSASTSPYAPLFSYGTSTVVKGTAAIPSPKVDLSRVSRSPSIPQFDPLPAGGLAATWSSVPKGTALPSVATVNLGTPGATTPSRYYYSGNLVMGGGSTVITTLNINGPVVLYINGDLTMTGGPNSSINLNSTGSAEIHVAGGLKVDSGSDGIRSYTADPRSLILISDNATTTTQFYSEGANPFYGVIYMPNTTASGGLFFNYTDTNTTTVYGAVSAAKITYQNNLNLHYDTSLRYATFGGVDQPYTVTDWRELDATEQATMP